MKASILLVLLLLSMVAFSWGGTDCWSNGWSCQDGGCYGSGGICQSVGFKPDGRPICRCTYGG